MLTPSQIVAELDKYIIGQHQAKKYVAIALRNRWRRLQVAEDMQKEIMPNNILMIGPTGVGKTEIARRLAKLADAPFVKVEASKFTEVGYVGRDVESMIRDLTEQAVHMVKVQRKEAVRKKAEALVEDQILDILVPPIRSLKREKSMNQGIGFNTPEITEEQELNLKTREKFREKLRNGELEERKIEIEVEQNDKNGIGVIGPVGMDDATMQSIHEMINGMMPKKKTKRKVTIAEARKLLLDEQASKLIDMDEVKAEAIHKTENHGIVFIDEIDKIAKSGAKSGGPDVSREGVQRDLLPVVEGSAVQTKYGVVHTDHILFIAAGAFHFAKPSDLIPELQGRFPIRVELQSLSKNDFINILSTPKNALTKQYKALFDAEGINLTFSEDAIEAMAEVAFEVNTNVENIGARRLHTVMSTVLNEFLYEIPDRKPENNTLHITREIVEAKLQGLVKNQDLSRFIL